MDIIRYRLSSEETAEVRALLASTSAVDQSKQADVEGLLFESDRLPRGLRKFVHTMLYQSGDQHPACVISGFPIDNDGLGNTPVKWVRDDHSPAERRADTLVLLMAGLFGMPFTLTSEHDPRFLVQNVFPIYEHRVRQMSSNSEAPIVLHSEDAFIPSPPDYLGLFCLRNPDRVTTEISVLDASALSPEVCDALRNAQYILQPDESNTIPLDAEAGEDATKPKLCNMYVNTDLRPARTPVLHGDHRFPTIFFDPFFSLDCGDPNARRALDTLSQALETSLHKVALEPGDFLWFDNRRVAHGRSPFQARFDGNDRWLKRIRVTRDLRRLTAPRPYEYLELNAVAALTQSKAS